MDILNYILILVITCMIVVPFVSFLFSWCCSIHYSRKTKHIADIAGALAKMLNNMTITTTEKKTDDPS